MRSPTILPLYNNNKDPIIKGYTISFKDSSNIDYIPITLEKVSSLLPNREPFLSYYRFPSITSIISSARSRLKDNIESIRGRDKIDYEILKYNIGFLPNSNKDVLI